MSNAGSKARAQARRDRASSTLDQIAFFGTFALGSAAVLSLKFVEMPQAVVTGVPVALMFVYLVYVLWTRGFALGDDRIGDNLYYLGFLFTLVSIAASLYEFTTTDNVADRIIVNFGVALTTTIVGVALRVTLMQVRGDPAEVERIARMDLTEAALQLRSQVDFATRSMVEVRIANEQAIAEVTTNAVRTAMAAMKESTAAFGDTVDATADGLRAHFDQFARNAVALNTSSTRLVEASEQLCGKLETIALPGDLIEKQFDGIARRIDASAAALETLTRGIGRASEELIAQGTGLQDLSARWGELSRLVTSQQEILQSLSTLGGEVELVKKQREEIRTQVDQATRLLVDLESSLVSLARGLVERVNA